MTAISHPLFGRLLQANGFKRRDGVLLLTVALPDGSPGTLPADATDILGEVPAQSGSTTLSVEGLRHLRHLAVALKAPGERPRRSTRRK